MANFKSNFGSPNKRQFNPLGDFSSYTYSISLYAITTEGYNYGIKNGRWDKKFLRTVAQSGGVNNTTIGDRGLTTDPLRAPGFDLDLYIDNLYIDCRVGSKDTGWAGTAVKFKFQVFEPYGFSFPTKLAKLRSEMMSDRGKLDEPMALREFLMITVRFYGYDKEGNLVTGANYESSTTKNIDEQATFERSFPIIITKFSFRLEGKTTVYDIEARPTNEQMALGKKHAEVNGSYSGETVGEVLGNLIKVMNQNQKDLLDTKKIGVADNYEIMFEPNSGIDKAKIVDENINKAKVPLFKVTDPSQSNVKSSEQATSMEKKRVVNFAAGLNIVQAIDQVITQSSYVTDALEFKEKEDPEQPLDSDKDYDKNPNPKTLKWYIIAPVVTVNRWDELRNDYAYNIKYVVKTYDIPYIQNANVKYVPKYPGPHKRYYYWYTGQNTEVITYEQNFDLTYFNAIPSSNESPNADSPKSTTPVAPKPSTNADPTGQSAGAAEPVNTIKSFLYDPANTLKAKIKIFGDPDWLMPVTTGSIGDIMTKWYGGDSFSINPYTGQVFFEIVFKQVEDYDPQTGILPPNGDIDFNMTTDADAGTKSLIQGMVFLARTVHSSFSKGSFTQELECILPNFKEMNVGQAAGETSDRPGGTSTQQTSQTTTKPESPQYADYDMPTANDDTATKSAKQDNNTDSTEQRADTQAAANGETTAPVYEDYYMGVDYPVAGKTQEATSTEEA